MFGAILDANFSEDDWKEIIGLILKLVVTSENEFGLSSEVILLVKSFELTILDLEAILARFTIFSINNIFFSIKLRI